MPDLDVSFVVSDPMLADTFTVTRRIETIGANGVLTVRTSLITVAPGTNVPLRGIVTQEEPATLMRNPEAQIAPRVIFVASTFKFMGLSSKNGVTWQPDLINWDGSSYVVKKILPYSRYGFGVYEVVAESMTQPDVPQ